MLSFGSCHHLNANDLAYIYRDAAAGDQIHAVCRRATGGRVVRHKYPVCFEYFDVGKCPRSFYPKSLGLAQVIEVAFYRKILLDASPKADGSDGI